MKMTDIDLTELKDRIEKLYGDDVSEQFIGFTSQKVDKWAWLSYRSTSYTTWPNNDDLGYENRVKVAMTSNLLEYRDVMGSHFEIEQSDRILGEFPPGGIIRFDFDSKHIGLESVNGGMHKTYWYARTKYEYDMSIGYIMSIIEANLNYMKFMFPTLLETKRMGDDIPKKWKRGFTLDKLLN